MADPLSATANILAVLVVSIQSTAYFVDFFQRLTDAPADVKHNVVLLQALHSTFCELHSLTEDNRFVDFHAQLPSTFGARLQECQTDLREVESRFRHIGTDFEGRRALQAWSKVKYTFSSEQWLVKFSRRLQMYHSAFTVDLVTIQIKLTVLYNSAARAVSSPPGPSEPDPPSSTSPSRAAAGPKESQLTQILAAYTEPVSVRADAWYSFETCLGRLEYWTGPVIVQGWKDNQRDFAPCSSDRGVGIGIQVYLRWGNTSKAISAFFMLARRMRLAESSSLRWNISFPRIVPPSSDVFEFIRAGNVVAVQLLLSQKRATLYDSTADGRGLLHFAATSRCVDMVHFLLSQGADPNARDEEGRTPLHSAVARSDNYEICRAYLEHGADIGNCDADGRTPLHTFFNQTIGAIFTNHRDRVSDEALVSDVSGMNILQYAAWSTKSGPEHLDPYLRCGQMYPFVARDHLGRCLIHFAAQRGNIALLKYLVDLPADVGRETRDTSGQGVLHYAVQSKRTEAIDLLVAQGADIHMPDASGRTPLHCAARWNNLVAVKRVVALCGESSLQVHDKSGLTAAQVASRHHATEVARYLESVSPAQHVVSEQAAPRTTRRPDGAKVLAGLLQSLGMIEGIYISFFVAALLWYMSCPWHHKAGRPARIQEHHPLTLLEVGASGSPRLNMEIVVNVN